MDEFYVVTAPGTILCGMCGQPLKFDQLPYGSVPARVVGSCVNFRCANRDILLAVPLQRVKVETV